MVIKTRYYEMGGGGGGMGGYAQMFAGGAQSTVGLYQTIAAYGALKKLQKKPKDVYSEAPELKSARLIAEQNAKYGYTPDQKMSYFQNLASMNNARYQKAVGAAGSNLAGAIQSGINYGNINALNNFAAQDADRKLRNQQYADSFAKNLQSLKNMQTQRNQQDRQLQEQALGAAVQAGVGNFIGGAQTFAGSTQSYKNPYDNTGGVSMQGAGGMYQRPDNTYGNPVDNYA